LHFPRDSIENQQNNFLYDFNQQNKPHKMHSQFETAK